MVSFEQFRLEGTKPVYRQLADHVKCQILLKNARDGDLLPSRREIAMQVNVNPNTVQKACKLMEKEGYVTINGNRQSAIRVTSELYESIQNELITGICQQFVNEAGQNRLSYKHVISLINELWEK